MSDSPDSRPPLLLWAAFAALALAGFCFGVWAGTQRSQVVEVASPTPPRDDPPRPEAKKPDPEPVKESPKPEPKVALVPKKEPEAKKAEPEAVAMAEPKKTEPEPKKPDPKPPEPKKVEPKKVEPKPPAVTFAKDVLPVFRANCINCHGAAANPKGGLDLRTAAAALKGGDGGPGLKAGDPDGSPIWQRVEDGSMPPNKKLTDKDQKLIKAWIEAGGK